MSRQFLDASIPELVSQLSTDEKISLLSAPNWWNTTAIPRLGIPSVRMSDGPNVSLTMPFLTFESSEVTLFQGVRGSSHFVSVPAQCLPVRLDLFILDPPLTLYY